ncbi:MAG: hypothetical protein JNL66_20095 [Alphaproteobacteria bacterium]|nr:hypothetical protein [Alphaproteobacteria bacterium]
MGLDGVVRSTGADGGGSGSAGGLVQYQSEGVAVDFTTPILANARIRPSDGDKLEVILSDLGGGRGHYVIPLRHLEKAVTMTVHDHTLCEEVLHRNASSPDDIRRAILTVAKMGLAGQKAAKHARQTIDDEQNERMLTTVCLVRLAITYGDAGAVRAPPTLNDLATDIARGQVKVELAKVARTARLSTDAVYNLLEEWGGIIASVGVPDMPIECRLRRLGRQVFELASQLRQWADEEISHVGDRARAVADHAVRVGRDAEKRLAALDTFTDTIVETVCRWKESNLEIRAAMDALAWTLNGWEGNLRRWREAAQISREEQQRVVSAILATRPIRADAAQFDGANDPAHPARKGSRKVQAYQDWKTGQIDYDAVRRLEALREQAL